MATLNETIHYPVMTGGRAHELVRQDDGILVCSLCGKQHEELEEFSSDPCA